MTPGRTLSGDNFGIAPREVRRFDMPALGAHKEHERIFQTLEDRYGRAPTRKNTGTRRGLRLSADRLGWFGDGPTADPQATALVVEFEAPSFSRLSARSEDLDALA